MKNIRLFSNITVLVLAVAVGVFTFGHPTNEANLADLHESSTLVETDNLLGQQIDKKIPTSSVFVSAVFLAAIMSAAAACHRKQHVYVELGNITEEQFNLSLLP